MRFTNAKRRRLNMYKNLGTRNFDRLYYYSKQIEEDFELLCVVENP